MRHRQPVTVRDFSQTRPDLLSQVGIIDQVVDGPSVRIRVRGERQPLSLLSVQHAQPLLDRRPLDVRRGIRELFRGGDALQTLPQESGQSVPPAVAFLDLVRSTGPGGEAEPQIVDQENPSEHERFQRIKRVIRPRDQGRHLPESVQMGEAVVGEVGQVAVNLAREHRGAFADLEQGIPQPLPGLGISVFPWLVGQGPANQGVVGEFHGS